LFCISGDAGRIGKEAGVLNIIWKSGDAEIYEVVRQ
jgi:predicted transcriptional regulator